MYLSYYILGFILIVSLAVIGSRVNWSSELSDLINLLKLGKGVSDEN